MSNPLDLFIGKEILYKTEANIDVVMVIKTISYGYKLVKSWSGNEEFNIPVIVVKTNTGFEIKYDRLTDIRLNVSAEKPKIKEVECFKCGEILTHVPEFQVTDHTPLENICWNNGTVGLLNASYGSKFDLKTFAIAVCDKCVTEGLKENTIYPVKIRQRNYNY